MEQIDWRKLYAANQAEIARAGISVGDPMHGMPPAGVVRDPMRGLRPGGLAHDLRGSQLGSPRLSMSRPDAGRALVHIPRGLDPAAPAALVCMLHGCTQDPAAFAAATLMSEAADRYGFVVIYPAQDHSGNPQACWNWFLPEHQQREVGEPAAIAGIVRQLIESDARCTIDPRRVFVAGLSSGGAMACILAVCYPDLFTAMAVHSGLAYGAATNLASAYQVMARGSGNGAAPGLAAHAAMGEHARPVPSIVVHGRADRTVAPANAIEVLRQSMAANHLAAPGSCDHDVARPTASHRSQAENGHRYTQSRWTDKRGVVMHELLEIDELAHAWSGGATGGSYTDPQGPSATEAIATFFELTGARHVS
ncbi:MAG: PHB depolymerase family esterase [Actinomycetota bacterium]|nr:PHB depolymerase family esterase [Actinomycetota bacterium]